jgi:hypothetical protein
MLGAHEVATTASSDSDAEGDQSGSDDAPGKAASGAESEGSEELQQCS